MYKVKKFRIIRSRKMRWVGHIAYKGEMRNAYKFSVRKLVGEELLGIFRHRGSDNIKIVFMILLLSFLLQQLVNFIFPTFFATLVNVWWLCDCSSQSHYIHLFIHNMFQPLMAIRYINYMI
jgi:hypothetical protein